MSLFLYAEFCKYREREYYSSFSLSTQAMKMPPSCSFPFRQYHFLLVVNVCAQHSPRPNKAQFYGEVFTLSPTERMFSVHLQLWDLQRTSFANFVDEPSVLPLVETNCAAVPIPCQSTTLNGGAHFSFCQVPARRRKSKLIWFHARLMNVHGAVLV